jgi:hypothetical protein
MPFDRDQITATGELPGGMKLISDIMPLEVMDVVHGVISESNGVKGLPVTRITGIFQRSDKKNANGRVYPREVLKDAVQAIQDDIKNRGVLGECDHPVDAKIHIDRVSHLITRLWMEGDIVYGEAEVLHRLPCGDMLKGLLEHKVQVGISSRGVGDMEVKEDESGDNTYVVQEGYRIVTFDAVMQPSVPGSQLMVMESRQKRGLARRKLEAELLAEVLKRFQ